MRITSLFRNASRTIATIVCVSMAGLAVGQAWAFSPPLIEICGSSHTNPQMYDFLLESQLSRPITLQVVETPLSEVVALLGRFAGIHIRIDQHALDDVGLDADRTLITKDFQDVPFRTVLDIMLRGPELTYVLRSDHIVITTPEEVGRPQMSKLYPVADLLGETESTESLLRLVTAALYRNEINGERDAEDGRQSRVAVFRGFLLLRATDAEHQSVKRIFCELRHRLNLEPPADYHPLQNLTRTTRLSLRRLPVDDSDVAHLENAVLLECLDLGGTRVTDKGLAHLRDLVRLRRLGLADTRVGNKGLEALADLRNLERLDLSYSEITSTGLHHLRRLTRLEVLQLEGTRVRDLEPLTALPALRQLYLAKTSVDDNAARLLAKIVTLEELDLRDVPITDAALEHLARLQKLRMLNLGEPQWTTEAGSPGRISYEAARRFQEALPECHIRGMPPEHPDVVPCPPPEDPFRDADPEDIWIDPPPDPFRDD